MRREYVRKIVVFEEHFISFKKRLDKNAVKKIYQILILIMTLPVIPSKYLKSIETVKGLYEIRVENKGNIYRIFCCFDMDNMVVLFNGIEKKTQKTPHEAITKAALLMKKYYDTKQ